MSSNFSLKNKTILVTRPEDLATPLLQRINEAGGNAQHYPVIQISRIDKSEDLNAILNSLSNFDIAIFISPTAVIKTLQTINTLPSHLTLAVIGRSTSTMLKKHGYQAKIIPDEFNSESLLQHPSLQQENVINKSIIIFRGIGGRDLLSNTLTERGANVVYAEIYKREKNSLASLTQNQLSDIDALTVTSNEGLQNLFDLTDNKEQLVKLPIIVPGDRAHKLANKLGFQQIIQATSATDDACLQALNQYFSA